MSIRGAVREGFHQGGRCLSLPQLVGIELRLATAVRGLPAMESWKTLFDVSAAYIASLLLTMSRTRYNGSPSPNATNRSVQTIVAVVVKSPLPLGRSGSDVST